MAEYGKKKNDELAALCKERGLPHTGKKADLVKRLEDHDAQNTTTTKPAADEDAIDWDEDPAPEPVKPASTTPAANAVAAGGKGPVGNPQDVPNQEAAIDPATTDDLKAADPPATAEEQAPVKDFSSGLAERTLQEEIEKRKARARKFGMPEDTDEIKALERALRFGTTALPGLLNAALPEKQDRKRGSDTEHDEGLRKKGRGAGRERPRPGAKESNGKPSTKSETTDGYPKWMTEKDREAADRRKARYA